MREFFTNNREKLIDRLQDNEMAILFSGRAPKSTADSYYRFRPDKNFYYFTGLTREHFVLTVLKLKDKVEVKLFVEEPNYDIEKWIGRKLTKEQVTEISGVETVEYLDQFKPYFSRKIYNGAVTATYLDLQKLSFDELDSEAHRFVDELRQRYPHLTMKSLHNMVSDFRVVKEEFEIDQIRNAIMLTRLGLEDVMRSLKPKLYEYQVESVFNHTIMMNGADGNAFNTIAASGENAVILHYEENRCKIGKEDMILLDLGAQFNQYASDITRTYPANGKFTDRQRELYEIVLKVNKAIIEMMKPGVPYGDLSVKAKEITAGELKRIGLIEKNEDVEKYYYHSVGHYMGLDTHDLGNRELILQPGMVLTCEPGLYIAEEKIGIRIEDDILITEDGNMNLSEGIIKEVEDIEAFMAKE